MNRNKISRALFNRVQVLDKNAKNELIICAENFEDTKHFLTANNIPFKTYRFAKCFSVNANFNEICTLSEQNCVHFICENTNVCAEQDADIMHLKNLTQNKYLGQGQTICIIDTGVYLHLGFVFPKCKIKKFIDLVNQNPTPYDDNGHGTFVSGIAGGSGKYAYTPYGYAPNADLVIIKALNKSGNSTSNTILDAMQWVYENHKAYNIKVVCMSFGANSLDNDDPLSKGAEALWKRGLVVVAAAGNSGPDNNTIKSPGNNPNIITVGAFDSTNLTVPEFSSRGPTIYGNKPDLLAPGINVTSLNNTLPPTTSMSGTSVAAPIVAGICADILSRYKNATNNQIKQFLIANCTPITGDKNIEGAGYINFKNLTD